MRVEEIGMVIRETRKKLGLNQSELALASGTATRFISDLENGKPSCHLGKTLAVLDALGVEVKIVLPASERAG
jgi:y4mF family transcriptional regulator